MIEILNIYKVVLSYWWIATPVVLFFILRAIWLNHIRTEFIKSLKWTVLEIKIPREVVKTPKAMEQFFTGIHATRKKLKFKDKYINGEVPVWHSLEIVGKNGSIHFFIRTQEKFRNVIESQIYAQYPQAEISEIEDYINEIPPNIPNKDFDASVTEVILTKEDAYPIRTYPVFFEEKEAEERSDPIAGLFEFLNSLDLREHVGIQILISPAGDEWKDKGEELVGGLIGKKVKSSKRGGLVIEEAVGWINAFINGFTEFFFGGGGETKVEEKRVDTVMEYLSPGKKQVVEAIEKNIAKLGFQTIIRFIYWAPKDIFSKDKITSIASFFTQFNTQNLNGFKPNRKMARKFKIFKKSRETNQTRLLLWLYKKRKFPFKTFSSRGFVFNTEELATVFHIPSRFVDVERMAKIEAKKGGPPTGLPIE